MIRKISKWILLAGCLLLVSVAMLVIYLNRPLRANQRFGGFERELREALSPLKRLEMQDGYFYLAGIADNQLYLGNDYGPTRILAVDMDSWDTVYHAFDATPFPFKRMRVAVRDSVFYLLDGIQPFVRYGITSNWRVRKLMDRAYFLTAEPVSPTGIVLLSQVDGENTLGRWHAGLNRVDWAGGLLERQVDGFFCTYGQLHSDSDGRRVVYVYRYRNEFLVTDTAMVLRYRAKTIDTLSQVKIKVGRLDEETRTLASPPLSVNTNSALDGNQLYIHSNIMAANEDRDDFERNLVIDVYDLDERGAYQYSFYIPKIPLKSFKGFLVKGERLFALFGDVLVGYELFLGY